MGGLKHDSETEGGRMRGGHADGHGELVGGVPGHDLQPPGET